MSEIDWNVTPIEPEPVRTKHEYRATVAGLAVMISEEGAGTTTWRVTGWVADFRVDAHSYFVDGRSVEQAKAQAIDAARRMAAAGITAEKRWPVACCLQTFSTKDEAEAHERAILHPELGANAIEASDAPRDATVLHVSAQVQVEDSQDDLRYRIAKMPDDDSPWWVVDFPPNARPVSVYEFAERGDAIDFRNALNDGDTLLAARVRAEEQQRREAAEEDDE